MIIWHRVGMVSIQWRVAGAKLGGGLGGVDWKEVFERAVAFENTEVGLVEFL